MDPIDRNDLIKAIHNFSPQRIMVIGDLMLDQYTWGSVERISQEAPIPVVKMEKEEFRLGGAANVASNISTLNCEAIPVGVIGKCHWGNRILDIFKKMRISTEGVITSSSFQTIVKQRILTRQQQLLRLDYEASTPDGSKFESKLLLKIKHLIPKINGIIFSDYAKGAVSASLIKQTISEALKFDLPLICDPAKGVDFSCYQGVTVIKPNRSETELATNIKLEGKDSILRAASILQKKCKAKFLTISLDRDGMLFFRDQNNYQFIATEAPEVHDTTGAGDMFVSILTVLLANRFSAELSVQLANIAAGLETSHLGVVDIPWSRILEHLADDSLSRKITTLAELKHEIQNHNKSPLIFANGYFDNISAGHLRFLLEINKIPGKLIVAINSDQSILRQKGSAPLLKEQDRARLLASLENVFRVIVFDEADASDLIKVLAPDVVVKGEQFKNQILPEQQAIQETNARVEYIKHFSWLVNSDKVQTTFPTI